MGRAADVERSAADCGEREIEAIVSAYETALLRYASRIVNNPVVAQDVVQAAFVKLVRSWPGEWEPTAEMRSWLYRVTHNEAVDHIRHEARLRLLHERQALDPAVTPGEAVDDRPGAAEERRAQVLQWVGRLHSREQQVLLLRLQEGLSYREISEITGRTEGNVGNILHHAVRKMARLVKKTGWVAEGMASSPGLAGRGRLREAT